MSRSWTRVGALLRSVNFTEGGRWLWTNEVRQGYAYHAGQTTHRVLYELLVGPIPAGLELDHLCRVPICVRPDHLEPVTRAENQRRRAAAQTHCHRNHEFSPENTYMRLRNGGVSRVCRTCQREAARRYKSKVMQP